MRITFERLSTGAHGHKCPLKLDGGDLVLDDLHIERNSCLALAREVALEGA